MRKRSEGPRVVATPPENPTVTVLHDAVNEQVVLAAAIVDSDVRAKLTQRLRPDYFLVREHRAAWSGLQELVRKKLDYDAATFHRLVGASVNLKYLAELVESRPASPTNIEWHVATLLWDYQRAKAVNGPISSLLDAVRDPMAAPERIRALARQVGGAFDGHGTTHLHNREEIVREQMLEIEKRSQGIFYPFGIPGLDSYEDTGIRRMVPGAEPGRITVITGIAGGGKSTFAVNVALGLIAAGRKVCFGAWEMGGGMTLELMAAIACDMSRVRLMHGQLSREEMVMLEDKMHALGKSVVFMRNAFRRNRGERASNEKNLDVVQENLTDSGADVFIADLWKRCLRETSPEEEEDALFRQQAMCDEMRVHGILVQQQRLKDVEQRKDKRPTREAIKGSAAWVEVADTILGVHRPALWRAGDDDKLEVFVLKQRYGKWPLGIEFDWDAERGSIKGGRSIPYEFVDDLNREKSEDGLNGFVRPKGHARAG